MKRTIHSNVTGKDYNPKDTIRILNPSQSAAYMLNKAELVDIYASRHYETGVPVLVYLFDRESTKGLYDAWCNHTLY